MSNKVKIILAILGAALIGGGTEAIKFYPQFSEILVGVNVLLAAVVAFVSNMQPKVKA